MNRLPSSQLRTGAGCMNSQRGAHSGLYQVLSGYLAYSYSHFFPFSLNTEKGVIYCLEMP